MGWCVSVASNMPVDFADLLLRHFKQTTSRLAHCTRLFLLLLPPLHAAAAAAADPCCCCSASKQMSTTGALLHYTHPCLPLLLLLHLLQRFKQMSTTGGILYSSNPSLLLLLLLAAVCCMLLQRFKQISTTGGILQVKEEAQQRQQQQQQQRRPGPFGVIGALPDADFLAEPELRSALLLLLLIEQLLLKPHIKRAAINLKLLSQLASKVRQCRYQRIKFGTQAVCLLMLSTATAAAAEQLVIAPKCDPDTTTG
jgi:hypothetical protein